MSKRTADLLVHLIDRLESSSHVQSKLGTDGTVISVQQMQGRDEIPGDPIIAIGVSEDGSERNNLREEKSFSARFVVGASKEYVQYTESALELEKLRNRVADIATEQRDGWRSGGVSTDAEIAWNGDEEMFIGALEVSYERNDPHQAHQNY